MKCLNASRSASFALAHFAPRPRKPLLILILCCALMICLQKGTEGSTWLVCLIAKPMERGNFGAPALAGGSMALPPRCLRIIVQRCRYCVSGSGTLAAAAKSAAPGADWLALWVANGKDDGDSDTATVEDPDVLVGVNMMQVSPL